MVEVILLQMQCTVGEDRMAYLDQITMIKKNIGSCVLQLLGVFPLQDWNDEF